VFYRQLASISGLKELADTVETMKPDNQLTNLVPNLTGIDPDDAFSKVPYEKGYTFLYFLEEKVGGASKCSFHVKSRRPCKIDGSVLSVTHSTI
jgi:hypothetical protein